MNQKNQLRRAYFARRSSLSIEDVQEWSQTITDHLLTMECVQEAQCPMLFLSMPREFQTHPLCSWYLNQGRSIALPRVYPQGQIKAHLVTPQDSLDQVIETHPMGFSEPTSDLPLVRRKEIDLVILPSLSASLNGDRLGHGGGYYDRFLPGLEDDAPLVLPIFQAMLADSGTLPMEAHDQRADWIVAEGGIHGPL